MKRKKSLRLLGLLLSLCLLFSAQSFAFAAQSDQEVTLSSGGDEEITPAPEEVQDEAVFIDAAKEAETEDELTEDEAVAVSDPDEDAPGGAAAEMEQMGASQSYGSTLYSYNEKTGELKVTFAKVDEEDVDYAEAPWKELPFTKLSVLKTAGDTRIPPEAFSGCESLKTVTLPATLRHIDYCAFSGCKALTEIKIPDSVESIELDAFEGCTSLSSVVLPKSLKRLGSEGEDFGTQADLTLVEEVGFLFMDSPLKTISISGNPFLTASGNALYATPASNAQGVKALILYPNEAERESFRIPEDVEYIGEYAFAGAPKLKQLALGKGCKGLIGEDIIRMTGPFYTESLESFSVNPDNTEYSAPGGVLYDKAKTTLIQWPAKKSASSYTTPSTCTMVGSGSFSDSSLEEIGLTEGVTEIGPMAFSSCFSLKKLTLPASLTIVGDRLFGYGGINDAGESVPTAPPLTDIFYTGTETQWEAIKGMADALSVYGENKPAIHYNSTPAIPSSDGEADYGGGGSSPDDEDAVGLNTHNVEDSLKDGSSLSLHLDFTGSTTYDGRKHVLSVNPVKKTAAVPSASQNPDIEVKNFRVSLDGSVMEGITLKSCSYKNNMYPGTMQLIPAVNYNSKDANLKEILNAHKDLKTVLGRMLNPKYDKKAEEWEYAPVLIEIDKITLSESTEVYNLNGKTSAEKKEIAKKDGVLVWNGKQEKITWSTRKVRVEADWNDEGDVIKWDTYTYYIPTKVTVPGLYYQRVFDLGKGKTAVKKINLRVGGWSIKSRTYSEDGEKYTERWAAATAGSYDYFFAMPDVEGGYLKDKETDERPPYIEPVLNTEGFTETRTRTVWYSEDGERWSEDEEYEVEIAKPGYFTGSLPSFDTDSE